MPGGALGAEPLVALRFPKMFDLRRDPFERAAENSNGYWNWAAEHAFVILPMQAFAAEQLQSFMGFPSRQWPAAFNVDTVTARVMDAGAGSS